MGTPDFAVEPLNALLENGYDVRAVITAPDKPAGRGKKLRASAVKVYAESKGLTLLQPVNLKDPAFEELLKSFEADVFVVIAFRMLPKVVWSIPPETGHLQHPRFPVATGLPGCCTDQLGDHQWRTRSPESHPS